MLFCKCWSPLRTRAPPPGGDGCLSFLPGTTDPDPSLGLHRNCLETVVRGPSFPFGSAALLKRSGAEEPRGQGEGLERLHTTGPPDTQSHTAAYNGLSGPFVITAAIPWIEGVDFLLLTLPQLCQLAFVSEGNRVENVTLQMEKLQAFCYCDCEVLGNAVHSERPF